MYIITNSSLCCFVIPVVSAITAVIVVAACLFIVGFLLFVFVGFFFVFCVGLFLGGRFVVVCLFIFCVFSCWI